MLKKRNCPLVLENVAPVAGFVSQIEFGVQGPIGVLPGPLTQGCALGLELGLRLGDWTGTLADDDFTVLDLVPGVAVMG